MNPFIFIIWAPTNINSIIKTSNNIDTLYIPYSLYYFSIYDFYIRKHLVDQGICKVDLLQKESIKYVSAKGQSNYLEMMINDEFFSDEEMNVIKRARNNTSKTHPKNTDVITYKRATGLEALIGYLDLTNNKERIDEIMNYILENIKQAAWLRFIRLHFTFLMRLV